MSTSLIDFFRLNCLKQQQHRETSDDIQIESLTVTSQALDITQMHQKIT